MAFETFSRKSRPPSKGPIISIHKRAIIALNAPAFALLTNNGEFNEETHIEFLFDPKKRIVGLRLADPGPNTYRVRKAVRSATYLVSGLAFTNYYKIPVGDSSTQYKAHDLGDGIVGFTLKEDEIK